jgi:hypothetical protein
MGGKSAPLLLIGLGTILLYIAYTGRLKGAWEGITGKYDSPPTTDGTTPTTQTSEPPITPAPVGGNGNRQGVYMVTATGDMVVTNPGIY